MPKYRYRHLKRSSDSSAPQADDMYVGEIAVNTLDGTAYTKTAASGIVQIGGGGGSDSVGIVTDVIVSGVFILVEKRSALVSNLGSASYTVVHSGVTI